MNSDFTVETLEKLFVKQILTTTEYVNIFLDAYDTRWMENNSAAVISNLVFKFYRKYHKIPSKAVLKELLVKFKEKDVKNKFDYNAAIDYLNSALNYNLDLPEEAIKKELKTFVEHRGLFFAISDNIEDIERNGNVDKCLKRFEKIQNIEFDTDLGMNYIKDLTKHFDEYILNPEARIKTLWPAVDDLTNGGFFKNGRSLYIIMGQAGLGKSAFLSNLALNFLEQNMTVVVISLEMSEDVYAQRFDAHISKYNINRLNLDCDETKSKIVKFFEDHPGADLRIKEYPPRTVGVSVIESYLEKLKQNGVNPDVIVVDYLNIVKPKGSTSDNMYSNGLGVAEELRALSYKFNVPVITAVQANTEGMNNDNIGMEHIAESRGIAHTADWIAALFQDEESEQNGIIRMRILKNRLGGRVGSILDFKLNPDTLILEDVSLNYGNTVMMDSTGVSSTQVSGTNSLSAEVNNLELLGI